MFVCKNNSTRIATEVGRVVHEGMLTSLRLLENGKPERFSKQRQHRQRPKVALEIGLSADLYEIVTSNTGIRKPCV
jgi:hypothetical protein